MNISKKIIPWEDCGMCGEKICNVHPAQHVHECDCPDIDTWAAFDIYPYGEIEACNVQAMLDEVLMEIQDKYWRKAGAEFAEGALDESIREEVDLSDAVSIALSAVFSERVRFAPAEIDFRRVVEMVVEDRAKQLQEQDT